MASCQRVLLLIFEFWCNSRSVDFESSTLNREKLLGLVGFYLQRIIALSGFCPLAENTPLLPPVKVWIAFALKKY